MKQEPLDIPTKKPKLLEEQPFIMDMFNSMVYYRPLYPLTWIPQKHISQHGQNTYVAPITHEPPILQNPERVVRMSECERFARGFQPNVALAPRQTVLNKDEMRERETRDRERSPMERENSVIKCDIKIKQERTTTPNSTNQSPELRNNSPETTGPSEIVTPKQMPIAPISPEGQSGSNEITSSTSPLPALLSHKQEPVSPPPPQISPNLTSPLLLENRSQNIAQKSAILVKIPTNNGITKSNLPLIGNAEFELSTDTDDDSLMGEPDSSNPQNWDLLADLVKNMSKEYQEKILSIFKCLVKENSHLRQNYNVNRRAIEDLRRKERDLIQENARLHNMNQLLLQQNSRTLNSSSVIASTSLSSASSSSSSSNSSLSSNSSYDHTERRNSMVEKPDIIIKPLKKSFRYQETNNVQPSCMTSSIILVPKREDVLNNNSSNLNNNNNINNNANNSCNNNGGDINSVHLVKNEKL